MLLAKTLKVYIVHRCNEGMDVYLLWLLKSSRAPLLSSPERLHRNVYDSDRAVNCSQPRSTQETSQLVRAGLNSDKSDRAAEIYYRVQPGLDYVALGNNARGGQHLFHRIARARCNLLQVQGEAVDDIWHWFFIEPSWLCTVSHATRFWVAGWATALLKSFGMPSEGRSFIRRSFNRYLPVFP